MKKNILAVCVIMCMSTISIASENKNNVQLGAVSDLTNMECSTATKLAVNKNGMDVSLQYPGSNEIIHKCVYLQKNITKQCLSSNDCMSYQDWSERNSNFSVSLPRDEFITYFEQHYRFQTPIMTYTIGKNNK